MAPLAPSALGIGTSEVEHVLATQTLWLEKPEPYEVLMEGRLSDPVTSKDLILYLIRSIGTAGGTGFVFEYRGEAVRAMSMEQRMTICNMSIEGGARAGMVAPDETTFEYLRGRRYTPGNFEEMAEAWKGGPPLRRRGRGSPGPTRYAPTRWRPRSPGGPTPG